MLKGFKNILKRLNNLRNPKLKQNCENCEYCRYLVKERRKEIINQLKDSTFGIAYIDTSEKIVPLENNLYQQLKGSALDLYNQFGLIYEGDNIKMVPTCQYKGCYITNPYFNGEKCQYFLGKVI